MTPVTPVLRVQRKLICTRGPDQAVAMSRGGFFNQLKDDFTKAFRPSASAPRCGMLRLPPARLEALAAWRAAGIPQFPPCLGVCVRA